MLVIGEENLQRKISTLGNENRRQYQAIESLNNDNKNLNQDHTNLNRDIRNVKRDNMNLMQDNREKEVNFNQL